MPSRWRSRIRARRFHDVGSQYYSNRIDEEKRTRNYIRQLQALGFTVTVAAA
jgi:transposase